MARGRKSVGAILAEVTQKTGKELFQHLDAQFSGAKSLTEVSERLSALTDGRVKSFWAFQKFLKSSLKSGKVKGTNLYEFVPGNGSSRAGRQALAPAE